MTSSPSLYDPHEDLPLYSLLKHISKEFFKGKPLHSITMPTEILANRSFMDRIVDILTFLPSITSSITSSFSSDNNSINIDKEEIIRGILVAFLSSWSVNLTHLKKPINPILGEVYFSTILSPKTTFSKTNTKTNSNSKTNNNSSKKEGEYFESVIVIEKVSHHPPVEAFYLECTELGLIVEGEVGSDSKKSGLGFITALPGHVTYSLLNSPYNNRREDKIEVEFSMPSFAVRNILMGKKYTEYIGEVKIKGDIEGSICFEPCGTFSSKKNFVYGNFTNKNNENEFVLNGDFTSKINYFKNTENISNLNSNSNNLKNSENLNSLKNKKENKRLSVEAKENKNEKELYEISKLKKGILFKGKEEEMGNWETGKIWNKLIEKINLKDHKEGNKIKDEIEKKERRRKKWREKNGVEFKSNLFDKVDGKWKFKMRMKEKGEERDLIKICREIMKGVKFEFEDEEEE